MIRLGPLVLALAGCASLCASGATRRARRRRTRTAGSASTAPRTATCGSTAAPGRCRCAPGGRSGWLCQALPEERAAFDAEIARLQLENAALKKEVLAHDLPLPAGIWADAPPAAGRPGAAPADREGSQIMGVVENVWRRLVAMIVSVQRDLLKRS